MFPVEHAATTIRATDKRMVGRIMPFQFRYAIQRRRLVGEGASRREVAPDRLFVGVGIVFGATKFCRMFNLRVVFRGARTRAWRTVSFGRHSIGVVVVEAQEAVAAAVDIGSQVATTSWFI